MLQVSLLKKRVNIGSGTPNRLVNLITSFHCFPLLVSPYPSCSRSWLSSCSSMQDQKASRHRSFRAFAFRYDCDRHAPRCQGIFLIHIASSQVWFLNSWTSCPIIINEWNFFWFLFCYICRDEFWDLYKNCFHQRVLEGRLRICMYGPKPSPNLKKKNKK